MTLAFGQDSIRNWSLTVAAIGTAVTVLGGWIKLTWARIQTEIERKKSEQAKQMTIDALIAIAPAINSLAAIAPALVAIVHEFESFRHEVAENTSITKNIEIAVNNLTRNEKVERNQDLVEKIARQSQEQHDQNAKP